MARVAVEAIAVLERAVRDPVVISDVVRKMKSRITAGRHQRRLAEYADIVEAPLPGLAKLLGVDPGSITAVLKSEGFLRVLDELHTFRPPAAAKWIGGGAFLEACYAIMRLAQPAVALETGVAHGYSTATILQALEDNGRGRLYSVDLPKFRPGAVSYTGDAVPARLRAHRWELHLGSERRVLPVLLKRMGAIDFFFHDSDTAYEERLHTWNLLWPHLSPGAVLALNMVHVNDAYIEFAEAHGLIPIIVPAPKREGAFPRQRVHSERISYLGLLRKPG